MTKVIIVGQGGHSKVIRDIISTNEQVEVFGYLDDKYNHLVFLDGLYLGPIESAKTLLITYPDIKFVIGIGNNLIRKTIVEKLDLDENYFITLAHSTAVLSNSASIGLGTVIMANTIINADTQIGKHTIINSGSIVEHDNKLGDFVHISPNATLTGAVHVEEGVQVGACATVIPNISIGKWSIIGAGATVIHHIPPYCTAVGIPARVKMKEGEEGVQYNVQT